MTIGIDLRCLPSDGSSGAGIAHAARSLTAALLKLETSWQWRVYIPRGADMGDMDVSRASVVLLESGTGRALRAAMQRDRCDVLFVPSGAVSLGLPIPAIPWVHDLAIFNHPEWFPQSWIRRQMTTRLFARGIRRAPFVFAASEDTKKGINCVCGVSLDRIHVLYQGGDEKLESLEVEYLVKEKQRARERVGNAKPFLLVLGTVEPRKNIECVVRAWTEMGADVDLVIAGRDGWGTTSTYRAIDDARRRVTNREIHRIPNLSDDQRRDLFLAASIVCVPSWHEGFGRVALEAMQAGTSVIVSNRGALPEVVGDVGMLIDPADVSQWKSTCEKILKNLTNSGAIPIQLYKRSQQFTWRQTATTVKDRLSVILNEGSAK